MLSVGTAGLFSTGQASVNLVAAVPSLHAAFTALVAMFLWPRFRRGWRLVLAAYPLAMGFTLVATGEHYVVDLILGWLYASAVMVAWGAWERRRGVSDGSSLAAKGPWPPLPRTAKRGHWGIEQASGSLATVGRSWSSVGWQVEEESERYVLRLRSVEHE